MFGRALLITGRILRSLRFALVLAGVVAIGFWIWRPGEDIRDGRDDKGENGMWIAHGWMGGDVWFTSNGKQSQMPKYRSAEALAELAALCRRERIRDLFPHLCPCDPAGRLPAIDDGQVERLLDAVGPQCRVIAWIGGTQGNVKCADARWRQTFAESAAALLTAHPRLSGVQVNIEPLASGDRDYLTLLSLVKRTIPAGKIMSVAAYPPPTRWQPSSDVHWDEGYFRAVAREADQMVVMTYDTGIRIPKCYTALMALWTREALAWSEGKPVLLGVPAYDDAQIGASYHAPKAENLETALAGLHAGLRGKAAVTNYKGAAIYSHWEMTPEKWRVWEERFRVR